MSKFMDDDKDYVTIKIVKHEKAEFSKKVIDFALENKTSYLDAILEIAETRKIEIEIVAQLITPELKALIENEQKKFRNVKKDEDKG